MTYPPPRYHGTDGEATATFRPSSSDPDLVSPSGTRVHYLATGSTTGGLFGLYRYEMGPTPGGPGPHFHRSITESFFILEGSVRIYDGRAWVEEREGGGSSFLVWLPGGESAEAGRETSSEAR